MYYQDERFAQIEREIRKSEEVKQKTAQTAQTAQTASEPDDDMPVDFLTQEDIENGIDNNLLKIGEAELVFACSSFFDDRFSIKFPQNFFELKDDSNGYLVYMNIEEQINCILNYKHGDGTVDLHKIKKEILKGMKASQLRTTWIEEGSKRINGNSIGYCVFLNHMPDQEIFNYMMFMQVRDGHVVINFNGNKVVFDIWEMLAKALMKTIEIMD